MVLVLRCLGVTVVGMAVVASAAALEAAPGKPSSDPSVRVVRVAQKQKTAKKKVRTKRAAAGENAPAPEGEAAPADASKVAATTPDGGLTFSRDIAPILVANCGDCHMKAAKNGGNFDMTSFKKLMEGSPKKKQVIIPGKPEESHLVLQIKGEEDPKMPRGNNRNLSEEAVAKIEQWVKSGALLDKGKDDSAPLASYAASPEDLRKADLAKLLPEQRDKQVEEAGLARWKKATSKTIPEVTAGKHFVLFSNLPRARAAGAVKKLDEQYEAARALVGPAPLEWGGEKASLFVFNDAASYGEFVQANQQRQVEAGDVGTARFAIPQPYVAVVDPLGGRDVPETSFTAAPKKTARPKRAKAAGTAGDDATAGGPERSLAGLLTENFVSGLALSEGKPPRWVSLGLGALAASHVEPASPYYRKIRQEAVEATNVGWTSKANDALGDQDVQTPVVRAVGFAILESIGATAGRGALPAFVKEMAGGGNKLDEAVGKVLNMDRQQFLAGTGQFVLPRYGR